MKIFKNRKLEIDILTIFILLISVTSAIIIAFTHVKNYQAILQYSGGTIHRVSDLIEEKIKCLFTGLERPIQLTIGLLKRHPKISYENQVLVAHFLDEVKYNLSLYGIQAASSEGDYLVAMNMAVSGHPFLGKEIPQNAMYFLSFIDASKKPPHENWYYYDIGENMISTEKIPYRKYDPRVRPWYIGALKNQGLFWTDVYSFAVTGKRGITVSLPVYAGHDSKAGEAKELIGVLGADLSLESFSQFLMNQKIGKTGRAFILNASGKIILPLDLTNHQEVVPVAYAQALKEKKSNLTIDFNNEKYLVSVRAFPTLFNENWYIVIVVPFLDYFYEIINTQRQIVLISIGILILAGFLAIYFSKRISRPIVILVNEVNKIKQLDLDSTVRVKSNILEIILLDSAIVAMRGALRSFSRYVPKELVKKLLQRGQEIVLGGEKREISLFFSDITGLTSIAESLPLETLNNLLAEYFDGMSKVILKNFGTIDKYIGDSIMAFWDAPDDMPDHAVQGCIAALECQDFVEQFNQRQRDRGMPELKTRIGINTGTVIAGNIGTEERMNYTVIGDTVNTTERLQVMNKIYRTKIIIGEEVVRNIKDQFLIRPLDIAEVKGKKEKIKIYELIQRREVANPKEIELAEAFLKAYEAYHSGRLDEAKNLFADIQKRFPDDYPTQIYLDRIKES